MKSPSNPAQKRIPLGEVLITQGLLTKPDLDAALAYRLEKGIKLGQALVALNMVSETDIAVALRTQGKINCIQLTPGIVDPAVAGILGEERSRRLQAIAINKIAGVVTVAIEDPSEIYNIDAISMHLGTPVMAVHAEPQLIAQCIDQVFRKEKKDDGPRIDDLAHSDLSGGGVNLEVAAEEDDSAGADAADLDQPVINMVRALLEEAFVAGASDIHLEPTSQGLTVRFRVDGSLYERVSLPKAWIRPVLARLKVLANLDIAERRLPQDGRVQAEIRGHRVDIRMATTPTMWGEGGVLRILDGGRQVLDLGSLGFSAAELERLKSMVEGGDGIVLATGPTGHGKTTTLYALLQHVHAADTKIITIEDPVENVMDGITQINANTKIGLTFARGLRSVLRQDPDIVLVGEIRDQETAQIAVQASLTGHLVLSTLHTVGTAEAVTRLADMGVEPFLLADTLRGIIAQRLVRRICVACRRPTKPRPEVLERLGVKPDDGPFYAGAGCEVCGKSGYKGRLAIYEIMRFDADLCAIVRKSADARQLREAARSLGVATLREDGIRKARGGETTLDEIYAATARG